MTIVKRRKNLQDGFLKDFQTVFGRFQGLLVLVEVGEVFLDLTTTNLTTPLKKDLNQERRVDQRERPIHQLEAAVQAHWATDPA